MVDYELLMRARQILKAKSQLDSGKPIDATVTSAARVHPSQGHSLPNVRPGDVVEWLSPALPRQQGEVLATNGGHFLVWHTLAESLCRLPLAWITRIVTPAMEDMK